MQPTAPRIERPFLVLAATVWLAVGVARSVAPWSQSTSLLVNTIWWVLFIGFGACLAGALRSSGSRALAYTIAQSALAMLLPWVHMPRIEGALAGLVAAQMGFVVPARTGWPWLGGQAVILFATIYHLRTLHDAARATVEYLAFGTFAMLLFNARREEQTRRQELALVNAELLATRRDLANAERVRERERIRQELHDGVGHQLARLSLELDNLIREPSTHHAQRTRDALDVLNSETRLAFSGPSANLNLPSLFNSLPIRFPGIAVRVIGELPGNLSTDAAWTVWRVAQEALTNAIKHGKAREASVEFQKLSAGLTMRVENDGLIPGQPLVPGQGMAGMVSRAAAAGGTVHFQAEKRFAVVLNLPMSAFTSSGSPA